MAINDLFPAQIFYKKVLKSSFHFFLIPVLSLTSLQAQESEISKKSMAYENAVVAKAYEEAGNLAEELAVHYKRDNNPELAVSYYKKALENFNKTNNAKAVIGAQRALGKLYFEQRNYAAAKPVFQAAYDLSVQYKRMMPKVYNGLIYNNLIDLTKVATAQNNVEEAMEYLEAGIPVAKELKARDKLYNSYKMLKSACEKIDCDKQDEYDALTNRYYEMFIADRNEERDETIRNRDQQLVIVNDELNTANNTIASVMIEVDSLKYFAMQKEAELKAKELEELKQKELQRIEEEKEAAEKLKRDRKNSASLRYIILVIIAFFVLVTFFAKERMVPVIVSKFFIFVSVIMLIEFIMVILEPYVEGIANNVILYKYLLNLFLVMMLFPLDYFLVKSFMKRLEEKNSSKA